MSKPNQRPGVPQQLPLSSAENTMYTEALPPPVDHRGYAGVRESRGLPVSCVHDGSALVGKEALSEALLRRICGHYEAAFKLLPVYGLRRRKYGADRIVLSPPLTGVRMPRETEGEACCAYEVTLRKILLDATYICYLQAFARLAAPAVVGAMHIPIVRSGFCFGPLDDPVDNILINAVWFKAAFPSQSPTAAGELLVCSERLAVLCARSLDAAIAYLCTRFGTVSRHDATLLLYRAGGCNVARAGELAVLAGHAPCNDRAVAIRAAVRATGHLEEARMANFVRVLSPEAKARVLDILQQRLPLGIHDLDGIAKVFDLDFYFPLDDGLLPEENLADNLLSTDARIVLEHRATLYKDRQRRISRNLDTMLNEEKKVLCMFGTTTSHGKLGNEFFHVNFLARDSNEAHWDLFFAQIWKTYTRHEVRTWGIPYVEGANKSVFFPLLWSAEFDTSMSRIQGTDLSAVAMSAGRCSHCEGERSKIFHPNNGYRGIHAIVPDQQCGHNENLQSDYVYFNAQTDIELIERLNMLPEFETFKCKSFIL